MSIDLRLPNLTATDTAGQLRQMRSYLHQLVNELNWALKNIDGTSTASAEGQQEAGSGSGAADPVQTFSDIKALIIKSADIVDAYYDQINRRLEGQYVAQSTFGTYTEQTDQHIEENSTAILQAFNNIQTLTTSIEGMEQLLVGVHAYINSGLLYYGDNGEPIYGIEVGQRTQINGTETFNKYARFTANKLSFYDANDNEVAYISDYKLYITNVEVTGSFRQGHLVSSTQSDGSIVRRYEGG